MLYYNNKMILMPMHSKMALEENSTISKLKALGHDIRADCIANGCGLPARAYALIENYVIYCSRGLPRSTFIDGDTAHASFQQTFFNQWGVVGAARGQSSPYIVTQCL